MGVGERPCSHFFLRFAVCGLRFAIYDFRKSQTAIVDNLLTTFYLQLAKCMQVFCSFAI